MHKIILLIASISFLSVRSKAQKQFSLYSPDKRIELNIHIDDSISYDVMLDGKELIGRSTIDFKTSFLKDSHWRIAHARTTAVAEVLKPVVQQKSSIVYDSCNQLSIDFKNGLSLQWRSYNNGVAWHWISNDKSNYTVDDEQAVFGFDKNGKTWYPLEDGFYSGNERLYKIYSLDTVGEKKLASLPVLFELHGIKVLLTESALFNYAGMWVRGNNHGSIKAVFPHYPKVTKVEGDRDERVLERENYIAKIDGPQSFPWRILMIERQDKGLLSNQMVYELGRPSVGDFTWVKPGKVQWDWWHYNNVYDVDFRAGINNDTYKYYIDFASKNRIEYVLLDEGWCDTKNLLDQSKDIDIPELTAYARKKGVGILLWTSWLTLDKQLDIALDTFAKWGVKGIKVDFMQRDDQQMVRYYEKVAKAAEARKMMVDFHGAYKPIGWMRTYPNVMTSEGVLGNEISKFAPLVTPVHTATLPYIRMAAGPMDFTPGGMNNVQKGQFAAEPSEPMTLGTRCNQMAMYVIFESPLQMLCDIPTHYMHEPECMQFLRAVPTVWQKTIPLDGKVGQYTVMARQALNGDWYIGAMTDWTPRVFTINLNFLPEGKYKIVIWKDGINADRNAKDFKMETKEVDNTSSLTIQMVQGGGYVARIIRL